MAELDGWPERPAFAGFRVVVAVKPDGRRVAYYDWPEGPDGGDRLDHGVAGSEATPSRQVDDDV